MVRRAGTACWISAVVAALLLAGCAGGDQTASAARVPVVATFYPLAEFARRVGGDRVEVRTLVRAGVESHDYEPTPRDLVAIERARVFIYNGAGFEPWVERVLPQLGAGTIRIRATAGLTLRFPSWASSGPDPHVWLDPVLAGAEVDRITAGLAAADPAGQHIYTAHARSFQRELDTLHRRYEQVLRSCRRKEFVTTHAAFGYLADRYGLRQVAIAGLEPEAEPSPARIREIVTVVRRSGTTVIYAETLSSPRAAEAIARETGATVGRLNPVEGLTPAEQREGRTYLSVMYDNLHQLAKGLDCRE